jgi:hypothetical protein
MLLTLDFRTVTLKLAATSPQIAWERRDDYSLRGFFCVLLNNLFEISMVTDCDIAGHMVFATFFAWECKCPIKRFKAKSGTAEEIKD